MNHILFPTRLGKIRFHDHYFKNIFGHEEVLLALLNAIIDDLPSKILPQPVSAVEYLDKEPPPVSPDNKLMRFDLLLKGDSRVLIDLESQSYSQSFIGDRASMHAWHLSSTIKTRGVAYNDLMPIAVIMICRHRRHPESQNWHTVSYMTDGQGIITSVLEEHRFLEVSKSPRIELKDMNALERFMAFFRGCGIEDLAAYDPIFKTIGKYEEQFMTPDNLERIFSDRASCDRATIRSEGKEERNFEVALDMLKDGISVDFVKKYTGLDQNTLLRLKGLSAT